MSGPFFRCIAATFFYDSVCRFRDAIAASMWCHEAAR